MTTNAVIHDPPTFGGNIPTPLPQPTVVDTPWSEPLRNPEAELRRACAEMLLAGSLLLADVSRAMGSYAWSEAMKATEERFRKALECGREALS